MDGGVKTKTSCFIQLGLLLNLTLTLLSVGYLTYKVHILEERIERADYVKKTDDKFDMHKLRRPRSVQNGSKNPTAVCTKCRDMCTEMFPIGLSKMVSSNTAKFFFLFRKNERGIINVLQ